MTKKATTVLQEEHADTFIVTRTRTFDGAGKLVRIRTVQNDDHGGQPVFVLKARDEAAPGAVRDWAVRASRLGAPAVKVGDALLDAVEMEQWQKRHGCKVPD